MVEKAKPGFLVTSSNPDTDLNVYDKGLLGCRATVAVGTVCAPYSMEYIVHITYIRSTFYLDLQRPIAP